MITRLALLDALEADGTIDAAGRQAAIDHDARAVYDGPWYLKALSVFGAWVAALFLLVWVMLLTGYKSYGFVIWGAILLAAVVLARPARRGLFVAQMALAACVCGQLMLAYGFCEMSRSLIQGAAATAVVAVALYAQYPDAGVRFLSPLLPFSLALAAVFDNRGAESALHFIAAVELGFVALAFTGPPRPALRPLGASAVLALAVLFGLIQHHAAQWPSLVLMAAALCWFCAALTPGRPLAAQLPAWVAIAALAALSTPGVLLGIGLVALGVVRGNRPFIACGCLFLVLFLSWFYYQLELTLAVKSWILIASGGALLVFRSVLLAARPGDTA